MEDEAGEMAIPEDWMASIALLSQQVEAIAARIGRREGELSSSADKGGEETSSLSSLSLALEGAEGEATEPICKRSRKPSFSHSRRASREALRPQVAEPGSSGSSSAMESPGQPQTQAASPEASEPRSVVRSYLKHRVIVEGRAEHGSHDLKSYVGSPVKKTDIPQSTARPLWTGSRAERFAFNVQSWETTLARSEQRRALMAPPPPEHLLPKDATVIEMDSVSMMAVEPRTKHYVVLESAEMADALRLARRVSAAAPPLARRTSLVEGAPLSLARRSSIEAAAPSLSPRNSSEESVPAPLRRRTSTDAVAPSLLRRGSADVVTPSLRRLTSIDGSVPSLLRRNSVEEGPPSLLRRTSVSVSEGPPQPGTLHALSTNVSGTGLTNAILRVPALFVIQARDCEGETCALSLDSAMGYKVTFRGPEVPVHTICELVESGQVAVQWVASVSGEYEISVALKGQHVTGSPFTAVAEHGFIDPTRSEVRSTPSRIRAGGVVRFNILARDQAGNLADYTPLRGSGYRFSVWADGPAEADLECSDARDGTQRVSLRARVAGDYVVHVSSSDGELPLIGSPFKLNCFAADLDPSRCSVSGEGTSTAVAGVTAPFRITLQDAYGNPCKVGELQLKGFTVQLRPRARGEDRRGPATLADPAQEENASSPDGTTSGRVWLDEAGVVCGDYVATVAGDFDLSIFFSRRQISGSLFHVRVAPAPTDTCSCMRLYAPSNAALDDVVAGEGSSFRFVARDVFGNDRGIGGDLFAASLVGPAAASADVLDMGDGTYHVEFAPTVAGEYLLSVVRNGEHVRGSPFALKVVPTSTCAERCVVEGRGTAVGEAGYRQTFSIQARDVYNNPRGEGGDVFAAVLTGPAETFEKIVPTYCDVIDRGDGTYELSYTLSVCGTFALHVVMVRSSHDSEDEAQRTQLTGSPYSVRISGGDTYGPACTREGVAPGQRARSLPPVIAGRASRMRFQARDKHGNTMARGGDPFVARLGGMENIPCEVIDHADGAYSVEYRPTRVGEYALAVMLETPTGLKHIEGSRFALSVVAAPPAPSLCGISGAGLRDTCAGHTTSFTIFGWDAFGNKAYLEPSDLRVSVESVDGGGSSPACLVRRARDVNGHEEPTQLVVEYTPTDAGPYLVTAKLAEPDEEDCSQRLGEGAEDEEPLLPISRGPAPRRFSNIAKSPYRLEVLPGPTVASACLSRWMDSPRLRAGEPARVQIQARDRFLNARTSGGDTFTVSLRPLAGPCQTLESSVQAKTLKRPPADESAGDTVVDNHDGSYIASAARVVAGTYSFSIHLVPPVDKGPSGEAGELIFESAFQVLSLATHGPSCLLSGNGLHGGPVHERSTFLIHPRDEHGNVTVEDPLAFRATMVTDACRGSSGGLDDEITVTICAGPNGTLAASYLPRVSGTFLLHISLRGVQLRPSPLRCEITAPPTGSSTSLERREAAAAKHAANALSWDAKTAARWEAHRQAPNEHVARALTQPGEEFQWGPETSRAWDASDLDVVNYAARQLVECDAGLSGHLGRYYHRKRAALLHHQLDGFSEAICEPQPPREAPPPLRPPPRKTDTPRRRAKIAQEEHRKMAATATLELIEGARARAQKMVDAEQASKRNSARGAGETHHARASPRTSSIAMVGPAHLAPPRPPPEGARRASDRHTPRNSQLLSTKLDAMDEHVLDSSALPSSSLAPWRRDPAGGRLDRAPPPPRSPRWSALEAIDPDRPEPPPLSARARELTSALEAIVRGPVSQQRHPPAVPRRLALSHDLSATV